MSSVVVVKKTAVISADPDVPIPMTQQEEAELKRVHNMLSNYLKKKKLENKIREIESDNENMQKAIMNEFADDLESIATSQRMENALAFADDHIVLKINKNEAKIKEIQNQIISIRNRPIQKISALDLEEILKDLNYPMTKKQIEEIIWEVDEDLDKCLNWDEFRLMYERNITDKTGLEPSRMFNLAQFLIYDKNQNGMVSVDETMDMLYSRYGRAKMEVKLKQIFGSTMPLVGRISGGEIDYPTFLKAMDRIQFQTFLSTTKGRIIAMNTTSKKQAAAESKELEQSPETNETPATVTVKDEKNNEDTEEKENKEQNEKLSERTSNNN